MKIWSIGWIDFKWSIYAKRVDKISYHYETRGDFFAIFILGLHIILDLSPTNGRKHKKFMKFIEILADIEHRRWSRWQKYLHSKCMSNGNGDLLIPVGLAGRWERQMNASYSELTEGEKESDREEARKFLEVLKKNNYFFKRR